MIKSIFPAFFLLMLVMFLNGCQQEESNSDIHLNIECEKDSESSFDTSYAIYAIAAMNRTKIAVVDSCANETFDKRYWLDGNPFELITRAENDRWAIYQSDEGGEQLLVTYQENKFVFH
ncbi:MAG: hypothetical protein AAFO07_28015 [Bacteroidota bacterium]